MSAGGIAFGTAAGLSNPGGEGGNASVRADGGAGPLLSLMSPEMAAGAFTVSLEKLCPIVPAVVTCPREGPTGRGTAEACGNGVAMLDDDEAAPVAVGARSGLREGLVRRQGSD